MHNSNSIKLCSQCQLDIPAQAKLCTRCGSRQDFFHWFGLSQTTLALLVALISVSAAFVPIWSAAFKSESKVEFFAPTFNGNEMRVLAMNSGDKPAIFDRGDITSTRVDQYIGFRVNDQKDALINPGWNMITGKLSITMSKSEASTWTNNNQNNIELDSSLMENLVLSYTNSNGKPDHKNIPVEFLLVWQFIAKHAENCHALEEMATPSLANNCISLENSTSYQP